jgi:hypothetical protein
LVGNGKHHLIPTYQPLTGGGYDSARKKNSTAFSAPKKPVPGSILTQHTGLPPRDTGKSKPAFKAARKPR